MILNTQYILSEIKDEKIVTENLLVQKDKELALKESLKEKKIQEQVAMIFKDKAYYNPFSEAAYIDPARLAQIKEKEKEEDQIRKKELKIAALTTTAMAAPFAASKVYDEYKRSASIKESFIPPQVQKQQAPQPVKTEEELQREKMIQQQEAEEDRKNKRQIDHVTKLTNKQGLVSNAWRFGGYASIPLATSIGAKIARNVVGA